MRISDWSSDVCSSDLLTSGNGWRIALFVILFMIALLVITMIVGAVTGIFGPHGSFGYVIGSVINSAVSAAFGLLHTAVLAAIYRQLAVRDRKSVVSGKRVSVRVVHGGSRILNTKKN